MAKVTPSPANPAIQSDEQAGIEAQEYVDAVSAIGALDQEEKAAKEALEREYDEKRAPHEVIRDDRKPRVQAWAEANRHGRKTITFPNNRKARWRTSAGALVVLTNLRSVAFSLLRRPNWDQFLKIELRANNIKADPKVLKGTKGLGVDQNEYFSIG